jgi:transglutaminase-like putative cysteine protease
MVTVDEHGNVYFLKVPERPVQYSAVSLEMPSSPTVRGGTRSLRDADRYLQLPPGSERVAELASSVTRPDDPPSHMCEKIQSHLMKSYRYTLEFERARGHDWVRAFLFEHRTGCCMHFASAMVLMLRTLGIPSRLVGGYYSAEKEEQTGVFVFRGKHAHAWVEAHLGPHGWVTFDPTPPRFLSGGDPAGAAPEAPTAQTHESRRKRGLLTGLVSRTGGMLYWYVLAAAAVIAFWAYTLWTRRSGPRERERRQVRRVLRFYAMFLRLLAERGLTRKGTETPVELARRARRLLPPDDVDFVTRLFCAMRYGDLTPTQEHIRRMHQSLERLSQ